MHLLGDLAAWHLGALGAFLLGLQFAAREIGFWLGRHRAQSKEEKEGVGVIVGAIMGLLAFVLALTLTIATTRNAERRMTSLDEANAIGTAWLQATAYGEGRGAAIAELLETYTAVRLDFIQASRESPEIIEAVARTSALQTEIWSHLIALQRERPGPQTTALMGSLNDTFDAATAMRFAMAYTIPPQLLWLLLILNVCAMASLGYQFGLMGKHFRALSTLMSLLLAGLLVEIVDLGAARLGNFKGDTLAYSWTQQGFQPIPVPDSP